METTAPVRSGKTGKISKIFYFLINFLLISPILVKNISLSGMICACGILAIAAFGIIAFSKASVPASGYIPMLFLADFCICVCLRYETLAENFDAMKYAYALQIYQQSILCGGLAVLGIAIGVAGLMLPALSWLTGVSGGAIGTSVILAFWSNGRLDDFQLHPGAGAVLAVFWAGVLAWTLAFQIAAITAPDQREKNIFAGIVLLAAVLSLLISEYTYLRPILAGLSQKLLELPGTLFAWESVLLVCAILLVNAAAIFWTEEKRIGVDALVLEMCAILIFAVKFLMSSYFMGCSILLLLLVVSMLVCLQMEASGSLTVQASSIAILAAETAGFLFLAKAFQAGLYGNALLAVLLGVALYIQYGKIEREKYEVFFSAAWIVFCVLEALAWLGKMRSSPEGVDILIMVLLMSLAALLVIILPHPDHQHNRRYLLAGLCACTMLLCLASLRPAINISVETQGDKAVISMEAARGGTVTEASYYWRSSPIQEPQGEQRLTQTTAAIPIQGNILTIVAVDSKGERASRVFWYPPWLFSS